MNLIACSVNINKFEVQNVNLPWYQALNGYAIFLYIACLFFQVTSEQYETIFLSQIDQPVESKAYKQD